MLYFKFHNQNYYLVNIYMTLELFNYLVLKTNIYRKIKKS